MADLRTYCMTEDDIIGNKNYVILKSMAKDYLFDVNLSQCDLKRNPLGGPSPLLYHGGSGECYKRNSQADFCDPFNILFIQTFSCFISSSSTQAVMSMIC